MTGPDPSERPPGVAAEDEDHRGEHNEIGFRNVDEEAEHDERGSQGERPGELPPRER